MEKRVTVKNLSENKVLVEQCWIADSAVSRMKGLLGRMSLSSNEGLWIEPCNSIHTFFMRFPIDVVYINKNGKVLSVYRNVKPWRIHLPVWGARSVLELPCMGSIGIREGDTLCLS